MSDEKFPRSPLSESTDALRKSGSESLTDALSGHAVFYGSAGEELRRAMEGTATAAAALRESIGRVPDFGAYSPPSYQEVLFAPGVLVENPTHETNKLLHELSLSVAALVDVSKKEANLTEAIRVSTEAALACAIKSSNDAATATKLVRISIWIAIASIVVGTGVTFYLDNRNNALNDARVVEERSVRQQEVRVLGDISARLAADAKERADAALHKQPKNAPQNSPNPLQSKK